MYKHKNGITLRKAGKLDLHNLKDLKNESWFGTHNIAILNELDQMRWYENQIPENLVMIALNDNKDSVGVYKVANIDWMNRKYDFSYDVFKNYRGKGFGTKVAEAGVDFGFEILNMHRVDAEVLENNKASYKCLEATGFMKEGVKRKCIHKCGTYLDSIVMGMLREEWKKLTRVKEYGKVCNLSYKPKDGS